MPFITPTAADFTSRFPAFDSVETDVVETALTESSAYTDDSWVAEADFRLAAMLMAAHVLTCDGHGRTVEAELAQAGNFTLYKSGSLTLQAKTKNDGWLDKTSYGRRYLALRRRSVPPIAVVC